MGNCGWPSLLAGVVAAGCATIPAGDPARGREVFISRDQGHCVACHSAAGIRPAGNVGPVLDGVASRLTAEQLRQCVVDITRMRPDAAMPAFHRTEGLTRVASDYRGKPVLSREQIDDVVAWLETLK